MGDSVLSQAGEAAAVSVREPSMQAPIAAKGLGQRFGKRWVVRGLDLEVPAGSITALLGRNGAGKSTTIQMLLGLLPPTEGEVRVLGHDPRRRGPALFEEVAYVSERRELLDDMTVDALARLVAEVHGARFDRDGFQATRARYKLAPDAKCAVLSKGQRARLLLALALAARPKVIVLDEPTSGLDVLVRDDFLEAIAAFVAEEEGRAVLLSTHIIEDVSRICDRAIVIREGGSALSGELDDLRAQVSRYVVRLQGVLPPGDPLRLPRGAVLLDRDPRALTIVASGPAERVEADLDAAFPVAEVERHPASFKEAFACWTEPNEEVA
jgi:ABC-2 type transport system ATP-binding protein